MARAMPIPNVTALVAKCWSSAETQARELLAQRYFDKDEEFITQLFHGEFRVTIEGAAGAGAVKQAFLTDLKSHFPQLRHSGDLERLAVGVSATATLHPREVEGETGGDLGLVLIRPNVNSHRLEQSTLIVDQDYRRGLLCQAKIKRRMSRRHNAQWGGFTVNQRKLLPDRMGYLALLLYEYEDTQRRSLLPFQWQVCAGTKFDDVEEWLKSDALRIGETKGFSPHARSSELSVATQRPPPAAAVRSRCWRRPQHPAVLAARHGKEMRGLDRRLRMGEDGDLEVCWCETLGSRIGETDTFFCQLDC
jgi:hypothetical protein